MAELLTIDDFTPHVGKTARFLGTPLSFQIDRVEGVDPAVPQGPLRTPFMVIFTGPRGGPVMREGLYACEIEAGPTYDLYVQPVHTPRPDRQEYQASFN